MSEVFIISDTHLFHKNILKFKRDDGTPLRPFKDLEEMHATIIVNWLRTVTSKDKVYCLGDMVFHHNGLALLKTLPGHKRLVRGNHDLLKTREYLTVFEEIYGVRQIDGYWMTHIPMHPSSMGRAKANIHGHLHYRNIDDPRYFNASVEQTNYTPISLDEIKTSIMQRQQ